MRTEYTCIGAYIDIEGLALVRFDLVDRKFFILETVTDLKSNYDRAMEKIVTLATIERMVEIKTIDVLSNFGSTLKNHIINNHSSERLIRVKTTPSSEHREDMIMNLLNIVNQQRIIIRKAESLEGVALKEMRSIDRKKLKDVYEGNTTLNSVLEALLHSVSWLESQMIKHRV